MILLINPRATRPRNRRFPLSLMAIGAALPEGTDWEILDGNLPGIDLLARAAAMIDARAATPDPVRAIALTVMPGPQLVSAVPLSKALKARYPDIPIIWGGYFGSLYPAPVLNAPYVDWVIRGQGEQTFLELLEVIEGRRGPASVQGLAFRQADGSHWIGPERNWVGPDELRDPPFHKIDIGTYLHPTILGRRSGVYQASIGCPFGCSFCGVISVFGRKEKVQAADRVAANLAFLVREHGMDSVHFYDNNFFLNEKHARAIGEAFLPLGISWWCEARVDTLSRFSDDTWDLLRRAGMRMVFCGAESGYVTAAERDVAGLHRMARSLFDENALFASAHAHEIRAAALAFEGHADAAVEELLHAADAFDSLGQTLQAAAARHRRGLLLGGEGGAQEVDKARRVAFDLRIANPERMFACYTPGFET
jgi:hypothetical protein